MRIPKPSYLLSQLASHQRPDVALYKVLTHLAELYQLGEIQTCHRARRSASFNYGGGAAKVPIVLVYERQEGVG